MKKQMVRFTDVDIAFILTFWWHPDISSSTTKATMSNYANETSKCNRQIAMKHMECINIFFIEKSLRRCFPSYNYISRGFYWEVFLCVSAKDTRMSCTAEGTQNLLNLQRETASFCSIQLYHIKHPDVAGWNTYYTQTKKYHTHHWIQIQVEHINCADVLLRERDRQSV